MAMSRPIVPLQKRQKDCFEMKHWLGQGGFGQVWRAYDKNHHRDCAIKRPCVCTGKLTDNLIKEAEKMMQVRDDNVLDIYGLCMEGDMVYGLILPFMQQGSLYGLLHHGSVVLPMTLRTRIIHQIARGMNALHLMQPHHLLHMDLKPANVLLTDNLEVKVADFGLARLKKQIRLSNTPSEERTSDRIQGTITHIPPEYLENGHRTSSTKFDIYSFAITVWEVLTGQHPFHCLSDEEIKQDVLTRAIRPSLDTIPPNAHHSIVAIMCQCWSQNPEERPEFRDIVGKMVKLAGEARKEAEEYVNSIKDSLQKEVGQPSRAEMDHEAQPEMSEPSAYEVVSNDDVAAYDVPRAVIHDVSMSSIPSGTTIPFVGRVQHPVEPAAAAAFAEPNSHVSPHSSSDATLEHQLQPQAPVFQTAASEDAPPNQPAALAETENQFAEDATGNISSGQQAMPLFQTARPATPEDAPTNQPALPLHVAETQSPLPEEVLGTAGRIFSNQTSEQRGVFQTARPMTPEDEELPSQPLPPPAAASHQTPEVVISHSAAAAAAGSTEMPVPPNQSGKRPRSPLEVVSEEREEQQQPPVMIPNRNTAIVPRRPSGRGQPGLDGRHANTRPPLDGYTFHRDAGGGEDYVRHRPRSRSNMEQRTGRAIGQRCGGTQIHIDHVENMWVGDQHRTSRTPSTLLPDVEISDPNGLVSDELKRNLIRKIHTRNGDGQNFFHALGLTTPEMREVYRRQENRSLAEMLAAMFEKWIEKEDVHATRRRLKDVCRMLGRRDLLQEIVRIP